MDQYVPCQCLVVKLENELGNRFLLLLVVCNIQAQTRCPLTSTYSLKSSRREEAATQLLPWINSENSNRSGEDTHLEEFLGTSWNGGASRCGHVYCMWTGDTCGIVIWLIRRIWEDIIRSTWHLVKEEALANSDIRYDPTEIRSLNYSFELFPLENSCPFVSVYWNSMSTSPWVLVAPAGPAPLALPGQSQQHQGPSALSADLKQPFLQVLTLFPLRPGSPLGPGGPSSPCQEKTVVESIQLQNPLTHLTYGLCGLSAGGNNLDTRRQSTDRNHI